MGSGKKINSKLSAFKDDIRNAYAYYKPNYDRYHLYKLFTFKSTLTDSDRDVLKATGKPQIESNIMEAFISRLRGEFSKQEPSICVTTEDGYTSDPNSVNLVEGHLRHLFNQANKDGFEYSVYTDTLSGGFCIVKIWTEYANDTSFNQIIRFGTVWDSTMAGFDPLARLPSKSDARFCFELFPMSRQEFEAKYPKFDTSKLKFNKSFDNFAFTFNNGTEDIIIVAYYYEKQRKPITLIELSDGRAIDESTYDEFSKNWGESRFSAAPVPTGRSRKTNKQIIYRYTLIDTDILEEEETDFKFLPLIFFDGNSEMIREGGPAGSFQEITRPYLYHALGIQRLKNFSLQCLGNELENMVQDKFLIPKEAIPNEKDYQDAWTNVQIAQTLVFNAYKNNNPDQPIPFPPREIQRVPAPPEVMGTFSLADQTMQMILGSFDASLGINDNQLSGIAIQEGATQSNSAAMPYITGMMQGLNQLATIIIDLLPKYYVTPRTLPIVGIDGKRSFIEINNNDSGIFLDYDENALRVKVEAGVSFAIQKSKALNQIIELCKASPLFSQFINAMCLEDLIDNLEIRGIDTIKIKAQQFSQQQQQQQQQQMKMMQQQQMNNPQLIRAQTDQQKVQLEQQKMQLDQQKQHVDTQVKVAELALEKQSLENDMVKLMSEQHLEGVKAAVMVDKADAEKARAAVDMAIKTADMKHTHTKDVHELALAIHKANHEMNQSRDNASA